MYLWKIERTDDVDYEENVGHVIAAEDELMVREIAAAAHTSTEPEHIWFAPSTTVEAVGESHWLAAGIVMTSNRGA